MARTGWMAGPVRPESGSVPDPLDPLRVGVFTFVIRWPRTARLLTTEFRLSRDQAWSVAWRVRRHRALRRGRMWLLAKVTAIALVASPPIIVFAALPVWEAFLESTALRDGAARVPIWAASTGAAVALTATFAWVLYERLGIDRLIERSIRDRWRDQICLWCSHDMDEASPHGDRWAVCMECGMRSPVAVRTP